MKHLILLLSLLLSGWLCGQVNDRLRALTDTDDATVWRQNLRYLERQPRTAFDGESRAILQQLLAGPQEQRFPKLFLLAGFIGDEQTLAGLTPDEGWSKQAKRYLGLARIRTGNAERRANLLKNVRRIELGDDFVYDVVPLLVYTRQREVFDYLWELVNTRNQACGTADAESTGRIDCGYRIVEYLAGAIVDFPVAVDDDFTLLTDDYEAALAEIRRWYAANRDTYVIDTNTY